MTATTPTSKRSAPAVPAASAATAPARRDRGAARTGSAICAARAAHAAHAARTASLLASLAALVATGCSLLPGKPAPAPSFFTLQPALADASSAPPSATGADAAPTTREPAPAILVSPPAARPGFDGRRMAYVQRPFELRYFARHQWVEPPARLLEPLIALALERGGRFRAVASGALVDPMLRLETEIVVLEQEFDVRPSRVRFVLGARLVDPRAGRLVATTELEALEPAPSDDPYGGVVAANRAVARVLDALTAWCETRAARGGTAPPPTSGN